MKHSKDTIMKKYLFTLIFPSLLFCGCSNFPSIEEIEDDIKAINLEIQATEKTVQKYSGGLLSILANVHLETLITTRSMLDQKKKGIQRFIPLSYSIDGKSYIPPENKNALLQEISDELEDLQHDLVLAEIESEKYGGGLLGVLSLTKVATIQNSIAFLNQRRLLLKHDIPYYTAIPSRVSDQEPGFKATPGEDIDKF